MDVLAIPEIDTKRTASNVKCFFKKDFLTICRRAGNKPVGVKAVVIDGMPKSPSYGNHAEESVAEQIDRQVDFEKVINAIKSLDETSKNIIIYNLIEGYTVTWCCHRLHMMRSRYHDYKKYALNAFADAYEYQTFGETDLHEYITD